MPLKRALPSSRPPVARMLKIHEELKDENLTNCTKLAEKLGVSTKTVMRDMAFLRDQLKLPLEYQATIYSWRYTTPVKNFPLVQVSEGELVALLVAQKALEQYKGTPYHDQLAQAFEKLTAGLNDQVSFSPGGGMGNVSFHHLGLGKTDLKVFERLSRAVLQSLEVEFHYKKPQSTIATKRRVQPYHLANRENSWYLVALDIENQLLKHYALSRMDGVIVTKTTFVRPADFSPEKHFGKSFGAFVGIGSHKIVIRFSAEVAGRVKERFWHESQETKELVDGRLEFTVLLDSLDEIQRWVLGWGAEAEVIGPKELREQVRKAAAAILEIY